MFERHTVDLLQKKLAALSLEFPQIVCSRSLRHDMDDLVAMALPGMRLAVVADSHTDAALGAQVVRALKGRFDCRYVMLEGSAAADDRTAEYVRRQSAGSDALVAAGSGSISDLCKYVSHQDGKPYVVFPTAASMNGYLSANASITIEGYKKTCAAHMPKAVFCDLSVIAAAPARLTKSGFGDSLARPTAQSDWLLSHHLLATPYDDTPFELLKPRESLLFDRARGIAKGDPQTIELLVHVLLLSGLGMTIAGGSYPASQGEHMIAHTYGMMHAVSSSPTFHGEEIGVTALHMAKVQSAMQYGSPRLRVEAFDKETIAGLVGEKAAGEALKAFGLKQALIEMELHHDIPERRWDKAREAIAQVMLPPHTIEGLLHAAEAPSTVEELGWQRADFETAATHARFLRERFTFLDMQ